jgi:hypothetical protein
VSACQDLERLVVARALGVLPLDDDAPDSDGSGEDAGDLAAVHVASCERCRALAERARACAPALALPEGEPRAGGWDALAGRIEVDRRRQGIRIAVGCAYCHGVLAREEAAYCAACLAPHHRDCFEEHGRCSGPGCGEARFVESRLSGPPKPKPKKERRPMKVVALLGLALAGAGVAALRARTEAGHLSASVSSVASATSELCVDLDAREAPLHDVASQLALVTGLNIVVPKQPAHRLTLGLQATPLQSALEAIAAKTECTVERRNGIYSLVYEPRLDLRYTDADVRKVIADLAAIGQTNIVIDPSVRGEVTLDLHQVHWLKALHAIVKTVGDFEIVEENEGLLRVVLRSSIAQQRVTDVIELKRKGAAAEEKRLVDMAVRQGGPFEGLVVDLDEASGALVVQGPHRAIEALREWVEHYERERDGLPAPSPAKPALDDHARELIEALEKGSVEDRRALAQKIREEADDGCGGDPPTSSSKRTDLLPVLEATLSNTDSDRELSVRVTGVLALCYMKCHDAFPILVKALENDNATARYYACMGIEWLADFPDLRAPAIAALEKARDRKAETDLNVKLHAASALREITKPDAAIFLQALKDEHANEALAANALADMGRKDSVELMIRRLKTADYADSHYLVEALKKLTGQDFGADAAKWQDWLDANRSSLPEQAR